MKKLNTILALGLIALGAVTFTAPRAHADDGDDSQYDYTGSVGLKNISAATEISLRAIELVNSLQGDVNYRDWGRYLLPIKKAAAHSYALARSHSEISVSVAAALRNLEAAIGRAADFIDDSMERSDDFNNATELMTLQEQIHAILE